MLVVTHEKALVNPFNKRVIHIKDGVVVGDGGGRILTSMRTQTKKRRKSRNFGYYVQEGLRGLLSHAFMSIAAIIIIAACLLITGSFSLVALNIQYNLEGLMAENEFLAYVDDTLTEEQARALQSQIESVPNVANVTFISAEEAKNSYLEDLGADDDLYSSLPSSVLRHRYSISVDDLNLLSETIQGVMSISGIADYSAAQDVANGFISVRNVVTVVTIGMVAVLLVISLFIISNAIKLATLSRQEEIAIMKMCGATNGFIRMPFVIEGIVLGLVSAILGFACQWGIYELLINTIRGSAGMEQLVDMIPFTQIAPIMGAIFGRSRTDCGRLRQPVHHPEVPPGLMRGVHQ